MYINQFSAKQLTLDAFRRFSDSRVVSGDKGRTRFDRLTGFVAVDASDNGVVVTGVVILVGFRG